MLHRPCYWWVLLLSTLVVAVAHQVAFPETPSGAVVFCWSVGWITGGVITNIDRKNNP